MNNDYIIMFDESGSAYIAHALNNGRVVKYYKKIIDGIKPRYFYSFKEYAAYIKNRSKNSNIKNESNNTSKNENSYTTIELKANRPTSRKKNITSNEPVSINKREKISSTPSGDMINPRASNKSLAQRLNERTTSVSDKMRAEFHKKNTNSVGKARYSEYRKSDPDFNDKYYTNSNRVGNTDFFMYKRADGRVVILEEDMKWVLPKNYDPSSSYVQAVLKNLPSASDNNWTFEQWRDNTTKEINNAINAKKK